MHAFNQVVSEEVQDDWIQAKLSAHSIAPKAVQPEAQKFGHVP